jgi:hypothetical protein
MGIPGRGGGGGGGGGGGITPQDDSGGVGGSVGCPVWSSLDIGKGILIPAGKALN